MPSQTASKLLMAESRNVHEDRFNGFLTVHHGIEKRFYNQLDAQIFFIQQ
jgi:hypothetical protein